jgi:hypothetical protein
MKESFNSFVAENSLIIGGLLVVLGFALIFFKLNSIGGKNDRNGGNLKEFRLWVFTIFLLIAGVILIYNSFS